MRADRLLETMKHARLDDSREAEMRRLIAVDLCSSRLRPGRDGRWRGPEIGRPLIILSAPELLPECEENMDAAGDIAVRERDQRLIEASTHKLTVWGRQRLRTGRQLARWSRQLGRIAQLGNRRGFRREAPRLLRRLIYLSPATKAGLC
jgi:hypothetical protein